MAKVQSRLLSLKVIYIQIFDLILLKFFFSHNLGFVKVATSGTKKLNQYASAWKFRK